MNRPKPRADPDKAKGRGKDAAPKGKAKPAAPTVSLRAAKAAGIEVPTAKKNAWGAPAHKPRGEQWGLRQAPAPSVQRVPLPAGGEDQLRQFQEDLGMWSQKFG